MKTADHFREAIKRIGKLKEYWDERDFASRVLPDLAESLGFKPGELLFEKAGNGFQADAVLAPQRDLPPWVLIETKLGRKVPVKHTYNVMLEAMEQLGCEHGLFVSPKLVAALTPCIQLQIDARDPEPHVVETAFELLSREAQKERRSISHSTAAFSTTLIDALASVEEAQDSQEKGRSLENLANLLLNGVRGLTVKYKNLRTRTSEIDLVVEYQPQIARLPMIEDVGRYFLVECKNWSKPAGASVVRDFIGKLEACRVNFGILFSRNGLTGEASGGDAVGAIRKHYDQFGRIVLVIALDDVRDLDRESFGQLLDKKIDFFRFDVGS